MQPETGDHNEGKLSGIGEERDKAGCTKIKQEVAKRIEYMWLK